ncbi:thioredoxin domain-containing protein [Streptomyces sp. BPTC-684]|uniref:DsbA family protein n=1 Tax=Streptomyces sp. BPTC-684 TaxID=3043734 RepID=UPI0024B17F86|nr:thioredoxin domain-containing protein [Streptomyces sp. BPTC-684]WHM39168.1 thioredoxin domain-containing protein [Streptomyces sp. BPTC-684]
MSEKNQEGKRTARERLAQERERQQSQDRRRRTMIVAAAVVCVLGLAAVIGVIAANTKSDGKKGTAGPLLAPTGAQGKDNLAIPVGAADAPSTLTVWEDFRCPACAMFENNFRTTLHELENSGRIRVEYHLATLIDRNLGGSGSLHAANAAGCAQDAGKFLAYHDVLYGNQPKETDDAFAKNSRLIELAGKVPGLDTDAFRSCVEDGKHDSWVAKSNKAFEKAAFSGTPTVQLNGESIFPKRGDEEISPAKLKKWVAEANKGKQPGTASPSQPGAPVAPSSPPAGASAASGMPKHAHAPGTAPKVPAAGQPMIHPSKAVPVHEAP